MPALVFKFIHNSFNDWNENKLLPKYEYTIPVKGHQQTKFMGQNEEYLCPNQQHDMLFVNFENPMQFMGEVITFISFV
jgi:hypothetical protein